MVCLGSFIAAALVGTLVLARSVPLAKVVEGRPRRLAYATALLTALFAAGMAGLAAYLVLSMPSSAEFRVPFITVAPGNLAELGGNGVIVDEQS